MRIVLIRRGQTMASRAHALDTARPGLPLTEKGPSQAEVLTQRWKEGMAKPPAAIIVSLSTRIRQTTAPLARKHGLQSPIRPGIYELCSGDIEMNTNTFSDSVHIESVGAWAYGLKHYRMGGGENSMEALAWALPIVLEMAHIVKEGGLREVGATVAHGAMLRLFTSSLADNIEGGLVMTHYVGNTGIIVLR